MMNNKLNPHSKKFIFNNTSLENEEEFWFGRMLYILSLFPTDFIDKVLNKDIDAIYKLYDLEEMTKYVILLDNKELLLVIKEFPNLNIEDCSNNSRSQFHWLFILRNLSFLLTLNPTQEKSYYTYIHSTKKIYSLIKEKYPNYNKFETWFYDLI